MRTGWPVHFQEIYVCIYIPRLVGKLSLQIVRHEPENFAPRGSLTSLRQTFWTELWPFCEACASYSKREREREREEEGRKTSTLKRWTSPGQKALRRLITFMMEQNSRRHFKRKWILVTYVLLKRSRVSTPSSLSPYRETILRFLQGEGEIRIRFCLYSEIKLFNDRFYNQTQSVP